MLHSPTIPHSSTARSAAWRSIWYSWSLSVCDGATTMLSPVWTRMLSTFSMLQTVSALPEPVPDDLVLELLEPADVPLEEDLADRGSRGARAPATSRSCRAESGDPAPLPAEGEGDADHHRVAELLGRRLAPPRSSRPRGSGASGRFARAIALTNFARSSVARIPASGVPSTSVPCAPEARRGRRARSRS